MCTRGNLLDCVLSVSDVNVKWKTCFPEFVYHVKLANRYELQSKSAHDYLYIYIFMIYISMS